MYSGHLMKWVRSTWGQMSWPDPKHEFHNIKREMTAWQCTDTKVLGISLKQRVFPHLGHLPCIKGGCSGFLSSSGFGLGLVIEIKGPIKSCFGALRMNINYFPWSSIREGMFVRCDAMRTSFTAKTHHLSKLSLTQHKTSHGEVELFDLLHARFLTYHFDLVFIRRERTHVSMDGNWMDRMLQIGCRFWQHHTAWLLISTVGISELCMCPHACFKTNHPSKQ